MNIGSTYGQNVKQSVYALKMKSVSSFAAEDLGTFDDCAKTMRIKTKGGEKLIKFNPYTLEVNDITTTDAEREQDPIYKKLKAAGLIDDDQEKAGERAKNFDDSLLGTVRWHYENLLAMKKVWETVVKIEEDQMEEIFDRLEHNTGDELSTEGVTEGAASSTDEALKVSENEGAEQNDGMQSDYL
ncbi:MAG: hypothetical protein HDT46_07035 [Ruminococcaceae bacterium]|nr:hypothetical protein [Oscillospiraceae bacterium]